MFNVMFYSAPFGKIAIASDKENLRQIIFNPYDLPKNSLFNKDDILIETEKQLDEYFDLKRKTFDLPIKLVGTPFQLAVWGELQKIPYGETCSYADIAQRVGSPKGFRAVGMANNKNPISIVIPCHRVIGKNGSMTGYGGGISIKEFLLDHEQK